MSDFVFEEIDETEVVGRVRGGKKLPKWTPVLSWICPPMDDSFYESRGYMANKSDIEEVEAIKKARLQETNDHVNKVIKILNDRKVFVQNIRETKEVRIKL